MPSQRRLYVSGGVFGFCAAVALALPGSFLVQQAGDALDVTEDIEGTQLLEIGGAETYPTDTALFMTTVSSYGNADMGVPGMQALAALFNRDHQIVPVRALYSVEESAEDVDQRNAAMMTSSQDSGTVAGLQAAGYTVPMTLTVSGADEGSTAAGKLRSGDILTSITVDSSSEDSAGQAEEAEDSSRTTTELTTFADLSDVLFSLPAGTEVTLGFTRDGEALEETMTTQAYEPDTTGWVHPGSRLGIYIVSTDLEFPVDVTYGVENIGGPSAGGMFALAIYDKLTEGSLGGDNRIAGTGTVSYNGDIGPIGGIPHKMVGADSEGARYFLAPAENCAETIGFEPEGMEVFAVRNLDDSIAATEAIGRGDTSGLTTCQQVVDETPVTSAE
ncbi:S16 family serine protease [Actinomycetaceae bacterium L2_0104]